jgi:hemerythrin-like metal-binding protein
MELFTWDNKYSVNNKELDNHHKRLFVIFNNLYKSCLAKDHKVTLGSIIEELSSYATYHFAAEEQYMKSIGYKDIGKHLAEHKFFADRITKQQYNKDLSDSVVSKETVLYLWNWLLNHVMTEDKKYAIHLNRRHQHGDNT